MSSRCLVTLPPFVSSPLWTQWQTGDNAERRQAVGRLSKQVVLSNVHVFRLLDDTSLLQVIAQLPAFLHTHPEVSLCTHPGVRVLYQDS